jgi:membrane protease subunit HflC
MKKWLFIVISAFILFSAGANCFFVLNEDESALLQRFGRIEAVYMKEAPDTVRTQLYEDNPNLPVYVGAGLKLKIPFIDFIIKYPAKLILYDSPPREVITLDRHRLYFDNTAQWRIENPLRFYEAYNNIDSAKTRIDDVLYSEMRLSVGQKNSYVLISDRETSSEMLNELAENVSKNFVQQGIRVVDIRIKRTDLPVETYASIYNRMNTERQQEAAMYRSEGEEIWLRIQSETDRNVVSITSQAKREAETIKGEGDSEAARIYNEAYGSSPEFFEFYNLLETYRHTIGEKSTLVVPLDSPFAKYLLGAGSEVQ